MKLPPEAIKEFQEAYRKDFGKEITEKEAEEMGSELLSLYSVICKPIKKSGNKQDIKTKVMS